MVLPHWSEIPTFGHGGLLITGLTIAGGMVANRLTGRSRARTALGVAVLVVAASVITELLLSTWYLFSPTYGDHIEASVASVAQYFLQGLPVYPPLTWYSFHGLVYGPLVSEFTSLGCLGGACVFGTKAIAWLVAWTAVAVLLLTQRRRDRGWAWITGVAWALCMLVSFGGVLTAARADSLLVLCAALALFGVARLPKLPALALAALLAGVATDLKLHGTLYVVPALGLWAYAHLTPRPKSWAAPLLIAAGIWAATVLAPFAPENVTWAGYLSYLKLSAGQGLSPGLLASNCVFLSGLWAPILLILTMARPAGAVGDGAWRSLCFFGATLLGAELAVTLIAAKAGAGTYHFLPFLTYHAFVIERLLAKSDSASPGDPRVARVAFVCVAGVLLGTAWPAVSAYANHLRFNLRQPEQRATRDELTQFADRYPRGMMGIADGASYELTNFRPWLTQRGTLQTDYGGWMDLKLSGVSDAPLAMALEQCRIPYLFVPKPGTPFTMQSMFRGPLFSDAVRSSFAHRYSLVDSGRYYDVFGCEAAH
jgi:hypothetical protein